MRHPSLRFILTRTFRARDVRNGLFSFFSSLGPVFELQVLVVVERVPCNLMMELPTIMATESLKMQPQIRPFKVKWNTNLKLK
jgi:hypothetical protein